LIKISSITVVVHSEILIQIDLIKAIIDIAAHCLLALDLKIVDFCEILPESIDIPS
jgi:hypothetical protein